MERKIFSVKFIEPSPGSVKVFTLVPEDGRQIEFKPGQFAMLFKLEGSEFGKLSRPYSIASSPLNAEMRFAIKMVGGEFTSFLDTLKPGDRLGIAAPFGHFYYNGEEKALFIAAGTGVAPMIGMLEYIAQKNREGSFTLFYSSKKEDRIICRALLEKFQHQNPNISIVHTLTQEQPANWRGELGRIDGAMLARHAGFVPAPTAYVCGPLEFAKIVKEALIKLGIEEKRIKIEAWG